MKESVTISNNKCENETQGHTCSDLYNCCDCGGNDCGCAYCWSCNACEICKQERE